jgi:hypothetical protein
MPLHMAATLFSQADCSSNVALPMVYQLQKPDSA